MVRSFLGSAWAYSRIGCESQRYRAFHSLRYKQSQPVHWGPFIAQLAAQTVTQEVAGGLSAPRLATARSSCAIA